MQTNVITFTRRELPLDLSEAAAIQITYNTQSCVYAVNLLMRAEKEPKLYCTTPFLIKALSTTTLLMSEFGIGSSWITS